jgi:hypothetical protein
MFTRPCPAGGRSREASCGCGIIGGAGDCARTNPEETRMVHVMASIVVRPEQAAPPETGRGAEVDVS